MQACTFHIGELLVAIPTEEIREIVLPQTVTPLPLAPALVRGLTHVRGDIHIAVYLHARLAQSESDLNADNCLQVILTENHGAIALLVDAVGDIVDFPEESSVFEPGALAMKAETQHNGEVLLLHVANAINPTATPGE
jgi:purine-binding chemotaxis protein CheW